jgi:hypothetical protein
LPRISEQIFFVNYCKDLLKPGLAVNIYSFVSDSPKTVQHQGLFVRTSGRVSTIIGKVIGLQNHHALVFQGI